MTDSECHHDCDHEEEPPPVPCEEEHEFVVVDAGDFQWSPLLIGTPPVVLEVDDFLCQMFILVQAPEVCLVDLPEHDPPPPGIPIFRRDGVLRL